MPPKKIKRASPSVRTLMKHEFNGVRFTPSVQPPPIVEVPWNQVTLQVAGDGTADETTLAAKDLVVYLKRQLGFKNIDATFDMRLTKVRLWTLKTDRPIRLSIFGFDNTSLPGAGAIVVLEAWPSKIAFARVGYEFPRNLRNIVWSSDSTSKFCTVDNSAQTPWLLYIDLLWRCNNFIPIGLSARFTAMYDDKRNDEEKVSECSSSFSLLSLKSKTE